MLTLESLEERNLLSLTPVPVGSGWPWTSICKLNIWYPDGQEYVGSGAVVDSFHVLTAGHVVYSSQDGGWATAIEVIPEMNGNYQPFGDAWMTYERTYDTFINSDQNNPGHTGAGIMDIGLLTLDRTIGYSTGWMSFGYDNNDGTFAPGTILNTAGYPAAGGYDGQSLYWSGGPIQGLSDDGSALQYYQWNITTYGGQSGSPVWAYYPDSGQSIIYGVHIAGTGDAYSLNVATRITEQIFNDFANDMAADVSPDLLQQIGQGEGVNTGGNPLAWPGSLGQSARAAGRAELDGLALGAVLATEGTGTGDLDRMNTWTPAAVDAAFAGTADSFGPTALDGAGKDSAAMATADFRSCPADPSKLEEQPLLHQFGRSASHDPLSQLNDAFAGDLCQGERGDRSETCWA